MFINDKLAIDYSQLFGQNDAYQAYQSHAYVDIF